MCAFSFRDHESEWIRWICGQKESLNFFQLLSKAVLRGCVKDTSEKESSESQKTTVDGIMEASAIVHTV